MKIFDFVFVFIGLAVCASCSVKADRRDCPCVMELDFSELDVEMFDSLEVDVRLADDIVYRNMLQKNSYKENFSIEVPKDDITVNVYFFAGGEGFELLTRSAAGIGIPRGSECPSVYMCSKIVDTRREFCREVVTLKKNFCRMSVNMVYDGPCPYILEITGNVCGYNSHGIPKKGEFNFIPTTDEHGNCEVDIPRQLDSSLRLVIGDDNGELKTFAIGEYIMDSGYNWDSEELDDIFVVIDYAKTDASIVVRDWDEKGSFSVII